MAQYEPVRIGTVAQELGLSVSRVRELADKGAIPSIRSQGGHRLFDLGAVREAVARSQRSRGKPIWQRTLPLVGLAEDQVWKALMTEVDHEPDSVTPALTIMRYAFTEMLNNAIDHSGGTEVWIEWWEDQATLAFRIRDNGIGAFAKVRDQLHLEDHLAAIQELSKGKTTTSPREHTGEGIFFTSHAVDVFELRANGWVWIVDNLRSDQAIREEEPMRLGTTVICEVDAETNRTLEDVFARFTDEDYEFSRSRISIKLFELGVRFISRSEAKRLLRGLERFREVEIDFSGVEGVGQGFVDELLRVWPNQHSETRVVATGMNRAVEAMVRRGVRLGSQTSGSQPDAEPENGDGGH